MDVDDGPDARVVVERAADRSEDAAPDVML
jgi:hypothetical protein